jgi:hypothetical protein
VPVAAPCPPVEVLEEVASNDEKTARLLLRDPKTVPREEDVRRCLELRGDPRRAQAAWYFVSRGHVLPSDLVSELLASSSADERAAAYEHEVRHAKDLDPWWTAIERDVSHLVVEQALSSLVAAGRYDGDPRLLRALRRVMGPRPGKTMISIALLDRLIPSAGFSERVDPKTLVTIWQDWLDRFMDGLVWDKAEGVFRLS